MKKTETKRIDSLASRAFADLIKESAPGTPKVAPNPEYWLAFRMEGRNDTFSGKAVPENGPEIFPYVAAALALFMLVPALFEGSGPTIEKSFASARDSGELVTFADGFKDTMIRVSQTLRR